MSKIKNINAREILDSRGIPTVEVTLTTEDNISATASVPSGASTGSKEALELRDNDVRYFGKGVLKAIDNVNNILNAKLKGIEVSDQTLIDQLMITLDKTENKSNLGANAILPVSIACLKAAAKEKKLELFQYLNNRKVKIPHAMFNIINGGMHAPNNLDIQEFMIVPFVGKFKENLRAASEIFQELKTLLKNNNFITSVGDEGGFAPEFENNLIALSYIKKSIEQAGYIPGKDVFIALDVAANSFYNENTKTYNYENKNLSIDEMIEVYDEIISKYPILSIEDPFAENDLEGFKKFTAKYKDSIHIIGDDLFVTNKKYLNKGIENNLCNSVLIKPNQIGTFYEMLETICLAKQNSYTTVMSHRSGETNDTYIADFAVGLNIPLIKSGSVNRGERLAKYNRLMEIEEILEKNE